ncbi:MAG: hypothetical protein JO224_04030 [Pelomonas sp.]|nr:hypothetical protein [Roseateles sp.]
MAGLAVNSARKSSPIGRPGVDTSTRPLEPLLPREAQAEPLLEKAYDLIRTAERLAGQCQGSAKDELVSLLRAMNSYYSNKIEGERTRPVEITDALWRRTSPPIRTRPGCSAWVVSPLTPIAAAPPNTRPS